jgi:hypothetical protein
MTTATRKIYFLNGWEKHKELMARLQEQMKSCPILMKGTMDCLKMPEQGRAGKSMPVTGDGKDAASGFHFDGFDGKSARGETVEDLFHRGGRIEELIGGDDAFFVGELGRASQAVTAHLSLGAIGVEDPHAGGGEGRRTNGNQAIAADAEVAVGNSDGKSGQIGREFLVNSVNKNVIVTEAVHF